MESHCAISITVFRHGCLIGAVAVIFAGGRKGVYFRRIESLARVAVAVSSKDMIMTNVRNIRSVQISRRSLLGGAIWASGAATMLVAADTQPARAAKISQSVVKYQDSPKGEQKCSNCKLFTAPNACQTVDGTVSPDGWCMIYQKA
jgi:hypothetical protein